MAIAMATTTEDFPRSDGIRHSNNKSEARGSFVTDDDQLFKRKKRSANSSNKQAAKLSKKKKLLARKSAATAAPTKLSKVVIESMTLSRLVEGLTIYGCIQEIDDFEIKFSITGGIVVKVPITNISSPYAKLIEEFASDVTGGISEIAKLNAIFEVGEYYPVKVLSKTVCDQFGHTEIIGSINPKDIYSHFTVKSLNNVPDGYNLLAAVSSLEDYGYEMDIGVAGVKAFLPLEDLKKNCQQSRLNIGQLVPCSLLQKNERSIILTTSKKLANVSLDLTDEPSVYSYVPGTRTKCLVTEVHNSGLELSLPGGYTGFVSRYHISDDIAALPKKFKIGDTVEGHVLYVQPHTKQICICLKSKLSKKAVKNLISTIRLGLVIEGAVICGVGEFGRTIFKLPSNNYAIALRKNLCDQAEYEALKLKGHFSIGSSHVCRVKQFHLFDNLIEISLKKSFIERKELSPDDLAVGAIVEGTIKKFKANGIYVRLGFGLNGFIPNMHLIDAPYVNLGKNRDKMFAEKKRIKCRITRLDTNSKVPKISLTVKKTLLAMKDSDIFADFSQIRPGMSSTGVVCLITEKGVLLEFFGRVSGFIPLKFLATYKIDHPEKVFAIGQLIKCTVVSVDAQAQRMVCSLIDVSETKKLKIQTSLVPSKLQNSSLKVGQILRKLKIISKSAMKGFDLTNDKQNIQVFLSLAHLSDDTHISRLLFSAFKVGDTIEEVMVFSVDSANVVTVTRKSAFLSNKDCLVTSEDDIQLNQPFPAIVRNVTHNGVFFETPNAHFGVIRRKLLQDGFYEEPHKLGLVRGQTVFVTAVDLVLHLDESEENGGSTSTSNSNTSNLKRFKFSMKLSDVWNRESEARVVTVKRRKTREERNEEARQRELELRQKELELGNTERTPQDEKDFEMAVMASPNSSLVWLRYMSFFLEKGDTAQARALAERALQRISFREEKEKLNIWIGLMNLENTYGDQASMDELVERAIKYNDPKAIYLQLASIYDNSNKKEKAEQIYHLAIKKFKQDKSTWMEFLAFYMQNGRLESARKLFQKSLLSLEKRDHVDIISKFAQLEFRYGDSEQAKTIFESMLATYWKRLDQWSVYIDMLVKYTLEESNLDSVEFVRNIFERLITFKLPPQKMKFIFKKYYDFESKFSSENFETLDRIKQKALEYIESDIF